MIFVNMEDFMKLIICEDQKILLDGLALSLGKEKSFEIVAMIASADQILPSLKATGADLVLSDIITEDNKNFLDVVKDIRSACPNVKIVAITGFPDIIFMENARKVGVDSFVYKNISTEELISVIKNTYSGYSVYPTSDRVGNMLLSVLSGVEISILRLYCNGKERDEICSALCLSRSALKSHVSQILQKTGFSSISRIAIYAVSTGLIFPEQ